MIVVVASRFDNASQKIVERWSSSNAIMCTCEDLSTKGWLHYVGSPPGQSIAVVGGREANYDDINGVLIRRPCIFEQELIHVSSADRTYVAGEMNAFLISWLSSLTCPVVNRPTALSLSGPGWRPERWVQTAARLGIPVIPVKKYCSLTGNERSVTTAVTATSTNSCPHDEIEKVTVVGKRYFGDVEKAVADQATKLAYVSGTELLEVRFSGSRDGSCFLSANTCPDISNTDTSDAVLCYLLSR